MALITKASRSNLQVGFDDRDCDASNFSALCAIDQSLQEVDNRFIQRLAVEADNLAHRAIANGVAETFPAMAKREP